MKVEDLTKLPENDLVVPEIVEQEVKLSTDVRVPEISGFVSNDSIKSLDINSNPPMPSPP